MTDDTDRESALVPASEEDYGGPVKSFLEHLEDLRWTLIKVVVSVVVAMLVAFVGANRVVDILTWPLDKANAWMDRNLDRDVVDGQKVVYLEFGTNITRTTLSEQELELFPPTTNRVVALRMVPKLEGSNVLMSLQMVPPKEVSHPVSRKGQLINLGPFEGFKVAFQVALYGGIALASPFIFLFIGQFVLPALKIHEKKYLYQIVGYGAVLFVIGVLFCYFALLQVVILAAVQFSNWLSFGAEQWRAADYIGTVCKLLLGMGLGFEAPIIILTMVKIGLLQYETMRSFRAYWVVISLIVSAFIMPPDGITMFMMAIPLWILFEISLLIARIWKRRDESAVG